MHLSEEKMSENSCEMRAHEGLQQPLDNLLTKYNQIFKIPIGLPL